MKLLIADDEKLTREGLCETIDWKSIGIEEIATADDGVHGIEIAKEFDPDIVLSDVRMPRMTGIEMCEQLQKMNPDLRIVFMSGYSDKEYLKSAIRLKAVSYVEKPIDDEEIKEAVLEAVNLAKDALSHKESKLLSSRREQEALAEKLCQPGKTIEEEIFANTEYSIDKTCVFTVIVKTYHQLVADRVTLSIINEAINSITKVHSLKCIGCCRSSSVFVFHIYDTFGYSDNQKLNLGEEISNELSEHIPYFHIVIGKNVNNIFETYNSYNSAVIELQNCFFSENRKVKLYKHVDSENTIKRISDEEKDREFKKYLIDGNSRDIYEHIDTELRRILDMSKVLPNQVKEMYYRRFNVISEVELMLGMNSMAENENGTWGMVSSCESIYELHEELKKRVDEFLSKSMKRTESSTTVAMIKEYIAGHYSDDLLSIKDISEHVFLSTSYVCTLFKNETGQTLNQYITDYRIKKAKELLLDPRNRIGDISKYVGYADGNYFGKTFKKQVGVTPSEFRESNGI